MVPIRAKSGVFAFHEQRKGFAEAMAELKQLEK
jgi:hypothetical protein